MNEQIHPNNTDIDLQRFYKYFQSIKDREIIDVDVKNSCINNIARLFADNFYDLEQSSMPEFQIIGHISSRADLYISRFKYLMELFSTPEVHKYLLLTLCKSFGDFLCAVRAADIHFLYAKKEEILHKINIQIEVELMRVSKLVPPDIADIMGKLVRGIGDPGSEDDSTPDISPLDPSNGGISLHPFAQEWQDVDSFEGLHHPIDQDDYRFMSSKEL